MAGVMRVRAGDWLSGYQRSWLGPDLVASVTVWALLVPEAMAYASVAGVPVQFGLYSVPLAIVGYALFGSSRQLFVGPSSTVAVLAASTVAPLAAAGSEEYVALVAALAFVVGALYVVLGFLRFGFIARLFAKPVLDGFIAGLGIYVAVGQLHKLVGVESHGGDTIRKFWGVVSDVGDWQTTTVVVGFGTLVLLFGLERISKAIPGAVVVVVAGLVLSNLADLSDRGVAVVGSVPTGFHFVSWSGISYDDVVSMVPGALGIIVVGFAQSIAIAKTLAARTGGSVDANAEMIGYGAASLGAGILQGYPPTGSLSKTAAARQAGARSPVAYLMAAGLVVATVLFLASVFEQLPEAVLGAIVIHAVSGMIDVSSLRRLRTAASMDFWAGLGALVGVVALGILPGLVIGVGLSLALFVVRLDSPHLARLGRRPDGTFADVDEHADAVEYDGTGILRVEAPMIFVNADHIADAVREMATRSTRVVLDFEAVYEIDAQGADTISTLAAELRQSGTTLVVARAHAPVRDTLQRLGALDALGDAAVYATVSDAVDGSGSTADG